MDCAVVKIMLNVVLSMGLVCVLRDLQEKIVGKIVLIILSERIVLKNATVCCDKKGFI